jgi:tRNA threonylcarbamoyladenosine biosynthesis protein TsaE
MGSPVVVSSAADMQRLAASLALGTPAPSLWLLTGPMGAGKTNFVQGFVAALDPDLRAQSPTYALARTYPCRPPVVHIDLYRYMDADTSVLSLGIDELCDRDDAHVMVEWPPDDGHQWASPKAVVYAVEITAGEGDHRTVVVRLIRAAPQ